MYLFQYIQIRVVSPEPEKVLTKLTQRGVLVLDVVPIDLLTVSIRIYKRHYPIAEQLLDYDGISYKVINETGFLWRVASSLRRPILVMGLIFFFCVGIFLPNRILFFRVIGNSRIPERKILYYADQSGMHFFSKSAVVRSETIKNQLLSALPQLQWVGVTTSGCVATIHVREKSDADTQKNIVPVESNIVAACDGVITEMIIYSGTPQITVGQAVKGGDLLVSGYTDIGQVMKLSNANAEIFAYTSRNTIFKGVYPEQARGEFTGKHTCYKLKLGKKVINLCNHSRISDVSCGKMYSDNYCYLPGAFRLPISLIRETYVYCELESIDMLPERFSSWLPSYAREYMQRQLVAGEILLEKQQWVFTADSGQLNAMFSCHEMIGRLKYEENVIQNAEDN